jgi:hypothetical protein
MRSRFFCSRGLWAADFDEFVWRDHNGKVHFQDQHPSGKTRHRQRVWPALSRYKRVRMKHEKYCSQEKYCGRASSQRQCRAIDRASLLSVLRRWDPMNPLMAWHIKRCDQAQRPSRPGWP